MPFARLHLERLIGGALIASALLASALGSLSPAAAQSTAAAYSGTYVGMTQLESGSSQVTPGDDPMCAAGGRVSFQVQDGRFRFPWHEPQAFDVKISANGSFYAVTGNSLALSGKRDMIVPTMQGRVNGADLQADYGTRWCRYHLDVTRF